MKKLKSFLSHYQTVLLDMDGVITSEEIYWNAAALTVWELLNSRRYFGTEDINPEALSSRVTDIRALVFSNDDLIRSMKNRGVNNNWDLAWLVTGCALIHKTRDFDEIAQRLCDLPDASGGLFAALSADLVRRAGMAETEAVHLGRFWITVQLCFQEWLLGSALLPQYWNHSAIQPGKTGLSLQEEPLVERQPLLALLRALGSTKRLGIGTGRPRMEAINPLTVWGVIDSFAPDALVTYQEVQAVQASLTDTMPGIALTKPHPYTFLKGIFGNAVSDVDLVTGHFDPTPCAKTLVIGDAACDLFAARQAGCDFAAVLTGIDGEGARDFFKQEKADYILHNILELCES